MTNEDTRRYEMLLRVRDFGEAHRDRFPASTAGGEAFAAVAEAVRQLNEHAVAKLTTAQEGKEERKEARAALLAQLTAILETAGAVGAKTPGFDNMFKLPKWRGDSALMTAGRLFVREAEKLKPQLVAYGLPETFLADAAAAVARLERAALGQATRRTSHTAAQTGIETAIESGLEAARALDAIVANQFRGDPVTRAAWKAHRRVDRGRRGRRPAIGIEPPPSSSEAAPGRPGLADSSLEPRDATAAPATERSTMAADVATLHSPDTALKVAS